MDLARSLVLILSRLPLHPCHTLDFRQGQACNISCRRTSLIQGVTQGLPFPESQPFPYFFPFLFPFTFQGCPPPIFNPCAIFMLPMPIPQYFPSTFQGCHNPNFLPRGIFMLLIPFPHHSTTLQVYLTFRHAMMMMPFICSFRNKNEQVCHLKLPSP